MGTGLLYIEDVWNKVPDALETCCRSINGDLLLLKMPAIGAIYSSLATRVDLDRFGNEVTTNIEQSKSKRPIKMLAHAYSHGYAVDLYLKGAANESKTIQLTNRYGTVEMR